MTFQNIWKFRLLMGTLKAHLTEKGLLDDKKWNSHLGKAIRKNKHLLELTSLW